MGCVGGGKNEGNDTIKIRYPNTTDPRKTSTF
jgi:hypothetical protein